MQCSANWSALLFYCCCGVLALCWVCVDFLSPCTGAIYLRMTLGVWSCWSSVWDCTGESLARPVLTVRHLDKKLQLEGDDTMFLVFEGPYSTLAKALLNASIVLAILITFCLAQGPKNRSPLASPRSSLQISLRNLASFSLDCLIVLMVLSFLSQRRNLRHYQSAWVLSSIFLVPHSLEWDHLASLRGLGPLVWDKRFVRGAQAAKTEAWIRTSCPSLLIGNSPPSVPKMS